MIYTAVQEEKSSIFCERESRTQRRRACRNACMVGFGRDIDEIGFVHCIIAAETALTPVAWDEDTSSPQDEVRRLKKHPLPSQWEFRQASRCRCAFALFSSSSATKFTEILSHLFLLKSPCNFQSSGSKSWLSTLGRELWIFSIFFYWS